MKEIIEKSKKLADELFNAAWLLHFYIDINTDRKHYYRIALYNTGLYMKEDEANELGLIKMYNKQTCFCKNCESWYRLSDEQIKKLLNNQ